MKVKKLIPKTPQPSENLTETLNSLKDSLDRIKNRNPKFTQRSIARKLKVDDSLISHVLNGKVKSKWLVTQLQKIVKDNA